jgi:hypothetical protein
MNIIEAIKLAQNGKKIRHKDWYPTVYIYKKYNEEITLYKYVDAYTREEVATFYETHILSDDWEIL